MLPWEKEKWLPGVLSKRQLKQLFDIDLISGIENEAEIDRASDYSSIDLHISNEGYEFTKGCIKPCGLPYKEVIQEVAERLTPDENGNFNLKSKKCYVFKLKESFGNNANDSPIYGQATAKSSIGRLDVITRLIVDGMVRYEDMNPNALKYGSGNMFLEIIPITFNIRVKEGIALSQLRLFYGNIEDSIINNEIFIKSILHNSEDGKGFLSVDTTPIKIKNVETSAFCASIDEITEDDFINLWENCEKANPCKYWRFIKSIEKSKRIVIENDKFYILRSKERIALPSGAAVYCRAMDETLGEMRIHYAGFAHPFFGDKRNDDKIGTPLIFEVRGHNVDVNLADGEKLAKLIFYRMSEVAIYEEIKRTKYDSQELLLSKFFNDFPNELKLDKEGRVS